MATVHGVAKSQTRLKDLACTFFRTVVMREKLITVLGNTLLQGWADISGTYSLSWTPNQCGGGRKESGVLGVSPGTGIKGGGKCDVGGDISWFSG